MPAIPKKKTSQTVWIAKWEHKHGEDISIHTTEEGAGKQCATWAREALEEWATPDEHLELTFYNDLTDDDLIARWPELTGETEFLYVEDHLLHGPEIWDEVWDEAKDEPKTLEEPKPKTWKDVFPEATLKADDKGKLLVYTGKTGLSPEVLDQLGDGAPYFQELGWSSDGELVIHTGKIGASIKTIDVFETPK